MHSLIGWADFFSKPNLVPTAEPAESDSEAEAVDNKMSKRASATRSAAPMLPLYTNEHPERAETASPPASAYLSPDGRRLPALGPEEEVAEHFSFSTTLRRHRRRTSDGEMEVGDVVMAHGLGVTDKIWTIAGRARHWWGTYTGAAPTRPGSPSGGLKEEGESASERFCSVSIDETLSILNTSPYTGLPPASIHQLIQRYGYNEFSVPPAPNLFTKFLGQITDSPLILLLLGSAVVSFLVGNTDDAVSITLAIFIVLLVGFVQEHRSEKSLQSLSGLVPHSAEVIRSATLPPASTSTSTSTSVAAPQPPTLGTTQRILANELVPGDLVTFSTGSRIPADVRIIHSVDLTVDESSLTGEGRPKEKFASYGEGAPPMHVELGERKTIAHLGTLVKSGYGRGIVIATGRESEFGRVFDIVQNTATPRTPLQTAMDALAHRLSILSFGVIGLIVLVGVIQSRGLLEMFTVGVSLAVAAIPEGLPIVTTVTLALGVLRMSRKRVIVKRLHSVEVMGCTSVIGVDKTGTLTKNEMTAVELWTSQSGPVSIPFSSPIELDSLKTALHPDARFLIQAGVVCNNASPSQTVEPSVGLSFPPLPSASVSGEIPSNQQGFTGNSTDVAIMVLGSSLDIGKGGFERNGEAAFSSESKWMGVEGCWNSSHPGSGAQTSNASPYMHTIHLSNNINNSPRANGSALPGSTLNPPTTTWPFNSNTAGAMTFVKGAVEKVLPMCSTHTRSQSSYSPVPSPSPSPPSTTSLDEVTRAEILARSEAMSRRGLRVIACAFSSSSSLPPPSSSTPSNNNSNNSNPTRTPSGLTFAGLIALHDPPRPGVKEAISKLHRGGVNVVMITGDGEGTACAIAKEVGILDETIGPGMGRKVWLTGKEIDAMGREELSARVSDIKVFARTTPKHKMKIVEAFKDVGEVVGMTGDGVNDAPALKRADIGISMGGRMATDVAKEAADVILVDDEFGTILAAVEEGKSIFHNIQNFLAFQLSTAVAALSLITLSTVFHLANPLNAMQILFINILMDGPPSQSLGVDPVDHSVMRKPPRKKDEPIITKRLLTRVLFSASMIILGTLYIYTYALSDLRMSHRDQTMTFTAFVFLDLVSAIQNRSLHCSLTANKMLLVTVTVSFLTQLTLIYVPFMQAIFQTEGLNGADMRTVGVLAGISFMLHEGRRAWERRRDRWDEITGRSSPENGDAMV